MLNDIKNNEDNIKIDLKKYKNIHYKMNSTTIDWNLIKLDTYEKQAEFLNSITVFGKPVMRVTPEYLAMEDEKSGFQSRKKLEDMIGKTT